MDWQAIVVAGATLTAFGGMASGRVPADLALLAGLAVVLISGAVEPQIALSGFGSSALLIVAALFVVAEGVRQSGLIARWLPRLLSGANSETGILCRLLPTVALASAFLNNTPVVAVLVGDVRDHAKRLGLRASRLLMPLSFAAILGGTLTLIGTSTNLVVADLATANGLPPMGLFAITALAVPVCAVGLALAIGLVPRLVREREAGADPFADRSAFTVEVRVSAASPLIGQRLDQATTADGTALNPAAIRRNDLLIPAPDGSTVLVADDLLVVAASTEQARRLLATPGLIMLDHQHDEEATSTADQHLIEVVVGAGCPVVGDRVGDGSFRRRYGAAVLAVARHGERIARDGVAGWRLRAGDTLLVEAREDFLSRHRASDHFFLIASHGRSRTGDQPQRGWLAGLVLVAMIAIAATGLAPMVASALAAAIAMMGLRLLRGNQARGALDIPVLIAIGAAMGLGAALYTSGVAEAIANATVSAAGDQPWLVLAMLVLVALVTTELVTNAAAASILVPIAIATAERLGVSPWPYLASVMVATSCSFLTPIGYQTNLMVAGPGGYRPIDFLRAGSPVTLGVGLTTVLLAPVIWPFSG